jgi:hypothetical protein
MPSSMLRLSPSEIVLRAPDGQAITVPIHLTPKIRKLTQSVQKQIISSGCLYHICKSWHADPELVRGFLQHVRNRVVAMIDGAAP